MVGEIDRRAMRPGGKLTVLGFRRAQRLFIGIVFGVALAYGVTFLVLWTQLEKRFVFFPRAEIESTPKDVGLAFQDAVFPTRDGLDLHGWFVPAPADSSGPSPQTWIWFHGNGGNIGHRVDELALLHHRLGVNFFIFDYRGYGQSQGTASEKGTYLDSRAALEYVVGVPEVDPGRIVYFGRSLGSAVAVELAVDHPPMGVVLVSPFTSVREMASLALPFPPAAWLVRNHYDSQARIGQVRSPLLVLHGDLDETVPLAQGKRLFDAANHPKTFRTLTGAAHNDTHVAAPADYWPALEAFAVEIS